MIKIWVILLLARTITGHCRIGLEPSIVICQNTTFEDYVVETLELDFCNPRMELSIKDSKIPVIYRMLNFDRQTNMIKISVNFCEVREVEVGAFSDLPLLKEIDLGFNQITDLNFMTALPSVISVNLTHNLIEVVDLASFNVRLERLDLSFNRIVKILLRNTVPSVLYLNDNQITELESNFLNVSTGFALYIFNNKITSIKVKDDNSLNRKIPHLLDFSNSITNLTTIPHAYWKSRSINLSNNNLKRLENFDVSFSNNYIIDFSNCSLQYIYPTVFQKMVNIDTLNLSHNVLDLLSRRSFSRSIIRFLDLSYNRIESISLVFDQSSIANLNLSHNNINEINSNSFQKIQTLISLDLSGNQNIDLKTSGFLTCYNLIKLSLASCNMSTLIPDALKGLKSLKILNLSCNSFQTLQSTIFKHLTRIEQIDLSYNQLTVIPSLLFGSLPTIWSVNLSRNYLSTIEPQAFYNLTYLVHIEINHNKHKLTIQNRAFYDIENIGEIQIKHGTIHNFSIRAFNQINNFRSLNLKDTIIENEVDFYNYKNYNINPKELHLTIKGPIQSKTFTKLVFLEKLYIWNSEIETVKPKAFQGLYKLKTLHLPGSKVKKLCEGALESLFNLESLDAASLFKNTEKLQSETFKHLHQIKRLNLSWLQLNQIEPKAFQGLRNLYSLNLSGNKLVTFTNLTFTGLSQLGKLNLSHNSLNFLERSYFLGLDSLKVLDLSNNKISDMDWGALQAFPNLTHLNLAYNNLTEFKVGAFSNLLVLNNLNLAYNSISELLFESFLPLTSLEILNLEDNNLKTIKHISLASNLKSLKRIGIANNKWKCEYLAEILVTFRNRPIRYDTTQPAFYEDNIDGIRCIDLCKYLLCLQDSHGIN